MLRLYSTAWESSCNGVWDCDWDFNCDYDCD